MTLEQETAKKLLEECESGSKIAVDKLARWCLPRVRRTIMYAYGSGADRDDLIQMSMSRIFSKFHTYRGDASFFVWVDRVTINVVKDHHKRKKLLFFFDEPEQQAEYPLVSHATPDKETERYRLSEKLSEHFGKINEKHRIPLVLSIYQGYTVPEIAAILDTSIDTIKMRLRRGRQELLKRLQKDTECLEAIREIGQ